MNYRMNQKGNNYKSNYNRNDTWVTNIYPAPSVIKVASGWSIRTRKARFRFSYVKSLVASPRTTQFGLDWSNSPNSLNTSILMSEIESYLILTLHLILKKVITIIYIF